MGHRKLTCGWTRQPQGLINLWLPSNHSGFITASLCPLPAPCQCPRAHTDPLDGCDAGVDELAVPGNLVVEDLTNPGRIPRVVQPWRCTATC